MASFTLGEFRSNGDVGSQPLQPVVAHVTAPVRHASANPSARGFWSRWSCSAKRFLGLFRATARLLPLIVFFIFAIFAKNARRPRLAFGLAIPVRVARSLPRLPGAPRGRVRDPRRFVVIERRAGPRKIPRRAPTAGA